MSEKIQRNVTTIKGESYPFESCKLINGKYYKIGNNTVENSGDCYIINNKVFLEDEVCFAKLINENKFQYFHKEDPRITYGIIDFVAQEFIFGYFKKNINSSKYIDKDGKTHDVISIYSLLNKKGPYFYNYYDNSFFSIVYYNNSNNKKVSITQEIKTQFPYSVTDQHLKDFSKHYDKLKESDFKKSKEFNFYQKTFQNTYGFEFETSAGLIPLKFLHSSGLMPLRDGSINGIEYASIPFSGAKGIMFLKKCCENLNTFTEFDEKCSMHIHIGGLERNIDNILAFLKLIVFTQNDFYKLFPLYKKYHFGYKSKSYAEPYPEHFKIILSENLNTKEKKLEAFSKIFTYLSQGRSFKLYENDLKNVQNHPADPQGNQKWNIKTRYKIVNLIPILFGNKKTVEFRIHTPTFNFNKLILFLYACDSLVVFANKNTKEILENNFLFLRDNVLETIISERISSSIKSSTSKFENDILYDLNENILNYFYHRQNSLAKLHKQGINFPNDDEIFNHEMYNRSSKLANFVSKINLKNLENKENTQDPFDVNLLSTYASFNSEISQNISELDKHVQNLSFKMKDIDVSKKKTSKSYYGEGFQ